MRKTAIVVGIVLGLLLSRGAAQADDAKLAKKHYEDATTAYDLGDFKTAIEKYKLAYQAKKDAVFLYNIAQAYRLSNDFQQASFFYKSYLRNSPNAKNRAEVEGRIAELEKQIQKARETAEAPPTGPVSPEEKDPPVSTPDEPEPDQPPVKIPPPGKVADESDEGDKIEKAPAPPGVDDRAGGRPIYKKWWFWGALGAVAVTAVVVTVVASGGGDSGAPDTDLGDFVVQ